MHAVLSPAPLTFGPDRSVIAPHTISGLPERVDAFGETWQRKSEFHLTAIAARVLEPLEPDRPELWEVVARLAIGRSLGPVMLTDDLRRCTHPERPMLRTLIVMADSPGLVPLWRELSGELGTRLVPPPAHVTLYSTDPDRGIGIVDHRELRERAPPLPPERQEALRRAMRFDELLGRLSSSASG